MRRVLSQIAKADRLVLGGHEPKETRRAGRPAELRRLFRAHADERPDLERTGRVGADPGGRELGAREVPGVQGNRLENGSHALLGNAGDGFGDLRAGERHRDDLPLQPADDGLQRAFGRPDSAHAHGAPRRRTVCSDSPARPRPADGRGVPRRRLPSARRSASNSMPAADGAGGSALRRSCGASSGRSARGPAFPRGLCRTLRGRRRPGTPRTRRFSGCRR